MEQDFQPGLEMMQVGSLEYYSALCRRDAHHGILELSVLVIVFSAYLQTWLKD